MAKSIRTVKKTEEDENDSFVKGKKGAEIPPVTPAKRKAAAKLAKDGRL